MTMVILLAFLVPTGDNPSVVSNPASKLPHSTRRAAFRLDVMARFSAPFTEGRPDVHCPGSNLEGFYIPYRPPAGAGSRCDRLPICRPFYSKGHVRGTVACRAEILFESDLNPRHPAAVVIFDLSEVPYIDSCGLGLIVGHFVRCQSKGIAFIAAGVGSRVLDLFKTTKVDHLFPITDTVEEAASLSKQKPA